MGWAGPHDAEQVTEDSGELFEQVECEILKQVLAAAKSGDWAKAKSWTEIYNLFLAAPDEE